MLTYRKKGVIRLLVGIVNKEQLPLTTDIVFHKVGYDITFTPEDQDFEPVLLQPSTLNFNGDGDGEERKDPQGQEPDQAHKKMKNLANPSSLNANFGTGSAPMHVDGNESHSVSHSLLGPIALAPVGKNSVMRARYRDSNGVMVAVPNAMAKPRSPYSESVPQQVKQDHLAVQESGVAAAPLGVAHATEPGSQDRPSKAASPTDSLVCKSPASVSSHGPTSDGETTAGSLQASRALLASRTTKSKTGQNPIARTPGRNKEPVTRSLLSGRSAGAEIAQSSPRTANQAVEQSPNSDVDMTTKAMQRIAARNLDANLGVKKLPPHSSKTMVSQIELPHSPSIPVSQDPGYVCHFPLAPYMGGAAEGGSASYGCAGYAFLGAGGQGLFFSGSWVAI